MSDRPTATEVAPKKDEEVEIAPKSDEEEQESSHFNWREGDDLNVIVNDVSEMEKLQCSFEVETKSHFVKSKTSSCFGNTEINKTRHKLLWADKPTFKHPYMVLNTARFNCHHGPENKKRTVKATVGDDHKYGKRRVRLKPSKKVSCPASIVAKEIVLFVDFKSHGLSKWNKDKTSRNIRDNLQKGATNLKLERQIHVKLPDNSEHRNHSPGIAEDTSMPIDARIVSKAKEYVSEGFLSSTAIRLLLETYVRKELFFGKACPPWTRRFFPSQRDITNLIYATRLKTVKSKSDQENLIAIVDEWSNDRPEDKIHFQPAVGDKDFLFVYQSKFQNQLLKRYGGDVCLLDATYRTTGYAVPIFFLCVKTNVDYSVVGVFSSTSEDHQTIAKALAIIRDWNPEWSPPFFMVDNCEAEIEAIEMTFQGCKMFLCDFHREQAWIRWLKACKHKLNKSSDAVLALLRNIARSESLKSFDDSVERLHESNFWKNNKSFRSWITNVWLNNAEKWVWCYRQDRFNLNVNTNNDVERQNHTLKHDFLRHYTDCSLTAMLKTIITNYLPEMHKRYIRSNIMASSMYRKYSSFLPKFLHNKPKQFVDHCRKRLPLKEELTSAIKLNENGSFTVPSFTSSSDEYIVSLGNLEEYMPSCQCHDWQHTHWPCKHLLAVVMYHPGVSWESLPEQYRSHPLFTLDDECTTGFEHEGGGDSDCDDSSEFSPPIEGSDDSSEHSVAVAEAIREEVEKIRSLTYLPLPVDVLHITKQNIVKIRETMWTALPKDNRMPVLQDQPTVSSAERLPFGIYSGRKTDCKQKRKSVSIADDHSVVKKRKPSQNISK